MIGAAVASGFAFIETTQYGYVHGLTTMEARNFWTLFSNHLLFTTPVLGALGLAANGEKLKLRHFLNWRVILCLALGMGCHALNNASKEYLPISYWFLTVTILTIGDYPLFMSQLIVAAVEWTALLLVLRGGIRQALAASERGKTMAYMEHYGKIDAPKVSDTPDTPMLCGQAGSFSGQKLRVPRNKPISMGGGILPAGACIEAGQPEALRGAVDGGWAGYPRPELRQRHEGQRRTDSATAGCSAEARRPGGNRLEGRMLRHSVILILI